MFDESGMIDAWAPAGHPLEARSRHLPIKEGQTVAQIVSAFDLDSTKALPVVELIRDGRVSVVPVDMWSKVRPKRGTHVEISYRVEGALAALGAALISAAAPAIATASWGFALTAGSFAYYATVAAITVVGGLLVNALVPPAPQPSTGGGGSENYFVTGASNQVNPYGVYPKVLGRHRIFPPMSAGGYSETTSSGGTLFRARYALGWGPLEIVDIRIGETSITEIDGITVEFLNVNQARTLANMPGLSGMTLGWRTGTARMQLYPSDIHEERHDVFLDTGVNVVRETTDDTESAAVDILFKQGLIEFDDDGDSDSDRGVYRFRYRAAGSNGAWTNLGETEFRAKSQSAIRFTKEINFPEPGRWEIEVTRINGMNTFPASQDKGWLSGIRSRAAGRLPSHNNIAEVAIKAVGSEHLAGQLGAVSFVVQQLGRRWTGSGWSGLEPIRHPAWVYADALKGPHLRRPVGDARIILDDLKAWADEEPHWTCDYVVDTDMRLAEVLSIIAAAGRARPSLTDLRYSITRDSAAGPVRMPFTPRNSWGFTWSLKIPRKIHALRCTVRSEALNWEKDEITVYADGRNASNATEFETLDLPGVVITSNDRTGGNAWRLGRYHLAQAIHRPESYEWNTDWVHLRLTRGDKVSIPHHDVPSVGVGSARLQSIEANGSELVAVVLDDVVDVGSDDFRVTVWSADGTAHEFTATSSADPYQRRWTRVSPVNSVDATALSEGDLVSIEELTDRRLDVLITGIYPGDNQTARITAVAAAPEVLEADQGSIPPYNPIVTEGRNVAVLGPPRPTVKQALSDESTMERLRDGGVRARVGVMLETRTATGLYETWVQLRWRETDSGQEWTYGEQTPFFGGVYHTGPLVEGRRYDVEVATFGELGRSRGWVSAGGATGILAQALSAPPPDVTGFSVMAVDFEARIQWERPKLITDLTHAEIRYSASPTGAWNTSTELDSVPLPMTRTTTFARPGTYMIKWVDGGGRRSINAASFYLSENEVHSQNAVETFSAQPDWTGTHNGTVVVAEELHLELVDGAYPFEGTWESDQVMDLGAVYPCRIRPFIEARGFNLNDNIWDWDNIWDIPNIWPSEPSEWRVEVDVAASATDPTAGSDWRPVSGGTVLGRYFKFRARLYSLQNDVTPIVESIDMVVDMPDRAEGDKDILVPAAGLRIDFNPAFTAIKSLVTHVASPGIKADITNKSRTGFDVVVLDGNNNPVEAEIDWQALGYGREA